MSVKEFKVWNRTSMTSRDTFAIVCSKTARSLVFFYKLTVVPWRTFKSVVNAPLHRCNSTRVHYVKSMVILIYTIRSGPSFLLHIVCIRLRLFFFTKINRLFFIMKIKCKVTVRNENTKLDVYKINVYMYDVLTNSKPTDQN